MGQDLDLMFDLGSEFDAALLILGRALVREVYERSPLAKPSTYIPRRLRAPQ